MKKKILFQLLLILLTIGFIVPVFNPAVSVSASSWTERADQDGTIYAGAGELPEYIEANDEEEQNWFMDLLTSAVTGIGEGFENLLKLANISLNSIIYGRVNGYDVNGVALFTFELNKGNTYGLVGAAIYQVFRMFSYAAIALIAFGKLSFSGFKRMTKQNIDKIKASLYYVALSFLLLALMPYLLDVVLYVRDVVLYLVVHTGSKLLLGANTSMDLIGLFRGGADKSLTGAVVYVASVFYSLYLAFLYVGYAMSFLVCFAAFPLVVLASNLKQDLLKNWVSSVAYFITIPVLDAGLLLVPAFFIKFNASTIITLFACMAMVQARSTFAKLLGVQDSGSGMMGMAAMFAAGRMIGSVVKTTAMTVGALGGASADMNMARYEEQMAAAEDNSGNSSATPLSAGAAGINSYNNSSNTSNGTPYSGSGSFGSSSGSSTSPKDSSTTANVQNNSTASNQDTVDTYDVPRSNMSENTADKYANVLNFESGSFGNQISHSKKADLYRQRAKMRAFQAAGSAIGGGIGVLAGGSAGLMMGPATTAMGVSAGANIGSNLGSMLGHSLSSINIVTPPSEIPDELFVGEVNGIENSVPVAYNAGASISNYTSGTQTAGGVVTNERIMEHLTYNTIPIKESANILNKYYGENAQKIMEPILKDMHSQQEFNGLSQQEAREKFRTRVYEQYMSEFYPLYDSRISRITSNDAALEAATKAQISNGIKKQVFNKDNLASFVSDEALNGYRWFDL